MGSVSDCSRKGLATCIDDYDCGAIIHVDGPPLGVAAARQLNTATHEKPGPPDPHEPATPSNRQCLYRIWQALTPGKRRSRSHQPRPRGARRRLLVAQTSGGATEAGCRSAGVQAGGGARRPGCLHGLRCVQRCPGTATTLLPHPGR
jgi:hypothetical protein